MWGPPAARAFPVLALPRPQLHEGAGALGRESEAGKKDGCASRPRWPCLPRRWGRGGCAARPSAGSRWTRALRLRFLRAFRSAVFVFSCWGRGSPVIPMAHTAEAEGAQAAPPTQRCGRGRAVRAPRTRAAPGAPARLRLLRPGLPPPPRALISSKRR